MVKLNKILLALIISICTFFQQNKSFAQIPVWKNYSAPTVINTSAYEGNFIWLTSSGGVFRFDTITKQTTVFNPFNSGLPCLNVFSVAIDGSSNKWFGTGGGPTGSTEAVFAGMGLVKFDGNNWTVYNTTNSGLPHNTVRSLIVDGMNNLWIGTHSGLAKFDGINWTVFKRANSGIKSDTITSLSIDNDGVLWIGSFKGLSTFDGAIWNNINITNSLIAGDTIRTITTDQSNNKWIGTSRGLSKYDNVSWFTYRTNNSSLPYNNVKAINAVSPSEVWIGTYGNQNVYGGGLTKFDGVSTWQTYNNSNLGLPKNNVPIILSGASSTIWFVTERGQRHGGGIAQISRFDQVNLSTYPLSTNGLLSNFYYHIEKDAAGTLWFAGEKAGLTSFDGLNWTNYNSDNSAIGDDDLLDMKIDTAGNIWAIHDWGKMTKFDGTNFSVYTSPNGNNDDPKCLFIDRFGRKWIGEDGTGIFIWNDTAWTNITTLNSGLPSDRVYAITTDSSNNYWIGTNGGGLAKFDGVNWTIYNTGNSGIFNNSIWGIHVDRFQNKWIATQNGLVKFDDVNWIVYRTTNSGMPSNFVYTATVDSADNVWVGTSTGIAKFNGLNWSTYNYPVAANFSFRHINFDNSGTAWIATIGRGILSLRDSSFVTAFQDQPLSDVEEDVLNSYPNPFSDQTVIPFVLQSNSSSVNIRLFDNLGREVLIDYSVVKELKKSKIVLMSSGLVDGVYLYSIEIEGRLKRGKLLLNRR